LLQTTKQTRMVLEANKKTSVKDRGNFFRSLSLKKLVSVDRSNTDSIDIGLRKNSDDKKGEEAGISFERERDQVKDSMDPYLNDSPVLFRGKSSIHSRVSELNGESEKTLMTSRSLPIFPEEYLPASPSFPRKPSYSTSLSTEEARKRFIHWKKNSVYRRKSELI